VGITRRRLGTEIIAAKNRSSLMHTRQKRLSLGRSAFASEEEDDFDQQNDDDDNFEEEAAPAIEVVDHQVIEFACGLQLAIDRRR
jgi:hypothetical protein